MSFLYTALNAEIEFRQTLQKNLDATENQLTCRFIWVDGILISI